MQLLITLLTIIGGLLFSISFAVLVEEFVFGQIFKLFFTPPQPRSQGLSGWIAKTVTRHPLAER
jgi:hypothetical protein